MAGRSISMSSRSTRTVSYCRCRPRAPGRSVFLSMRATSRTTTCDISSTRTTSSLKGSCSSGRRGSNTKPRSSHIASMTHRRLLEAARHLASRDRDLRRVLKAHGPPPLWARRPGFRTLIQIILEQQVSLASARAIFRRLGRGVVPFTPGRFAALGVARLRSLGLTRQKAAYCIHVAEAIEGGHLDLGAVARMDDKAAGSTLTQLKGVGPWTARIYLLMALRRPDVWPSGDIALVQAVRRGEGLRQRAATGRGQRIAPSLRPLRAGAARVRWA